MKKKNLTIGIIALVILLAAISVGLVLTIKGYHDLTDKVSIVGTWTEDSTGVEVTLTESNVFQVLGSDAAVYQIEEESDEEGTITLTYAKEYGGQVVTMKYTLSDTKLTLKNSDTKEVQTYTRQTTESENK